MKAARWPCLRTEHAEQVVEWIVEGVALVSVAAFVAAATVVESP